MKPKVLFYNIVLLLSHISAQWQAYLLAYLQVKKGPDGTTQPLSYYNFQEDLGMTAFQVTIVTGSVYTFTNGFSNLFFGAMADIYPRKWIWLSSCILWSVCTFAESYC